MLVKIKRLNEDAIIPKYMSELAAGCDLHSVEDVTLNPSEIKVIKTGLAFEIPEGFEMQVRPRSGLSAKHGIVAILGTVDADYRGEVGVILLNASDKPFAIKKGDRIGQAVFSKCYQVEFVEVDDLTPTERGDGGFGSTGIRS